MSTEPMSNIINICKHCSDERHNQWQKDNPNLKINVNDFIKVGVTQKQGKKEIVEHLWFKVLKVKGKKYFGICDNQPINISMKYKDTCWIDYKAIEGYIAQEYI